MKKGQTALEFLMTYGWAILIVAIVGAVLWQMGVFSPGSFTGSTQSGFQDLVIDDWAMRANGNITMSVGYRESGTSINITDASITSSDCGYSGTVEQFYTQDGSVSSISLTAGETKTATFKFSDPGAASGDSCNIDMAIAYTDLDSGIGHNSTGTFRGQLE